MIDEGFAPGNAVQHALRRIDRLAWRLGGVFQWLCNGCLLVMMVLTTATMVLRPFDLSAYWIWPWTMVFFVWLSFFGFFAVYVRLRDIRVDFLARAMGRPGMAFTRVLSDVAALAVAGVLMSQMPTALATSTGFVDGAILPGGEELARQALSVPLFISAALILASAALDLAKMLAGMPENRSAQHPEA